ncbi:type I-C CRISPR-associated protein Cas8c/Csd1 [Allofournierella massiliensis]|uniref:Type I-C CRISPR-associated protein Cas8c/Csd1 n=1 Tax=Allofournierella massiliensis TaxID=1650663 RepID=A0ABT7UWK9_9FIRM|nr:type I-C CRISPR-associated protein Cas8c/Csd1 [Fournierella massiliensis]MDM8202643.1 type I-C CRISPR-associated protein Cas8c/Csd1 [Fournierella massiliensis]
MILQALTQYYEDLLALGKIARPGWAKAKVSWALELSDNGELLGLLHLQQEVQRGKKTVLIPQEREVPQPVKRSSGVAANFLCDTSGYLLGVDTKGKPERTAECFAASRMLHERILKEAQSSAARAVLAFYEHWNPQTAKDHPALKEEWDEVMKGGNLLFWYRGGPVTEDAQVRESWQHANEQSGDAENTLCLVTGQHGPTARLHPNIKRVVGAQTAGAALVSFNASAFCSYEHEQGDNAPTSEYASFAYTTALNALIADREHTRRVGDTTIVCWAAGGQTAYQDFMMAALYDDNMDEREIRGTMIRLSKGESVEWQEQKLSPDTRFYVLGLAPNAARLSVRFFWQNSFGTLIQNVTKHYRDLEIVRPSFDKFPTLPVWRLLRETVNQNARNPEPNPRLAGDLLLAVLNGTPYPATLLDGVVLRIRAEREITHGRAAILKAWYLRNSKDEQLKEVMTVELNEQSNYLPYLLGRLFAVLEDVQQRANPGINTTIKDRYFNSASATPATVFPLLINLAQKHLAKLDKGLVIHYNRKITELNSRITQTLPARLTLPEQSAFQIGYYHETQKRYTKKEEV